jgi:hypothetical protein
MNVLTSEDIEFLRDLGNELKTQDNHGNRTPIFFQVKEPEKVWGIDPEYADGAAIFFGEPETPIFTIEEAKADLIDDYEINPEKLSELKSFDDIKEFCEGEGIECLIGGYKDSKRFSQMFLTESGFKQHMKMNSHNYNHGSSFWVDSFFRNPQMERLIEIVEKFATVEDGNQR